MKYNKNRPRLAERIPADLGLSFLSFLSCGYMRKTVRNGEYSQPWTVLYI